jgi:hypothetical protein
MIKSNFPSSKVISPFILFELNNSEGLGGRGPEGIMLRFDKCFVDSNCISDSPAR